MKFSLKKIHHLIRYFLLLSVIIFIGYVQRWHDDAFLVMIGPVIFLAHYLKQFIFSYTKAIPSIESVTYYGFLLPVTLVYFGALSCLLKQLWNERGFIRTMTLFALFSFLLFIHYKSWYELGGFSIPNP